MTNLTLKFPTKSYVYPELTFPTFLLYLLYLLFLTYHFCSYFAKGPQAGSRTSPPELSFRRCLT
jgi:hypothetical protein